MTSKALTLAILAAACTAAPLCAQLPKRDYPSCNLTQQRRLRAPTGGAIHDSRQAHIAMRANILQADIGNARKARRLNQPQAQMLWKEVERIRRDADRFVAKQGFLSGGETASYDRALDAVAMKMCR
ncbi:hypothetical protein P0F65_14610 [Sphingomonas sp. I4]